MGQGARVQVVDDPFIRQFPGLAAQGYKVTSLETPRYNCIAWAAGQTDRWWWPERTYFWPEGIPREETIAAFVRAFEAIGFGVCDDAVLEPQYEKVAIYANAVGRPLHAARQLPSGRWTSKLGASFDIEHWDAEALNGQRYGSALVFMKRERGLQ